MMLSSKLRTLVLALVTLCFVSCETSNNHAPDPAVMCLEVNGEHYDVPLPCNGNLNLRTLCSEFAADIKVLNYSDFSSITIADKSVINGAISYTLPTDLTTAGYIPVDYTTATQHGSFLINAYPEGIPGITHQGKHALLSKLCKARKIDGVSRNRRIIHFKIAGMYYRPHR